MRNILILFIFVTNLFADIHLMVAGDIMSHLPQVVDAKAAKGYEPQLKAILPQLTNSNFFVANLETPLAGGKESGYPCFNAPDLLAKSLKNIGVDLVLTANNHTLDKGINGVFRTIDVLDKYNILHTGTYKDYKRRQINGGATIVNIGEFKVAFLGYTYGLNGFKLPNDIPWAINVFTKTNNNINYSMIKNDLVAVKKLKVDFIVVMIHWGVEYTHTPNMQQKKLAKFLAENGVDLVLGGHSHVLQPIEFIKTTSKQSLIVYSLGNLISNQNKDLNTRTTAILDITLNKQNSKTIISKISYIPYLMVLNNSNPVGFRRYLINATQPPKTESKTVQRDAKKANDLANKILALPSQ